MTLSRSGLLGNNLDFDQDQDHLRYHWTFDFDYDLGFLVQDAREEFGAHQHRFGWNRNLAART